MKFGSRKNKDGGDSTYQGEIREIPDPAIELDFSRGAARTGTTVSETTKLMIRETLVQRINPETFSRLSPVEISRQVEDLVVSICNELRIQINEAEQIHVAQQIADDMTGFGPIQQLMIDPEVSDVLVNDVDKVYVERKGRLSLTNVRFRDVNHIKSIAQKMARFTGRRVDEANPLLDARLPDGSRVNIVFPPISLRAPFISIRRVSNDIMTLDRMMEMGGLDLRMKEFLEMATASRLNIIISGGTGSGKTTLLNALSQFIDSAERIVTIEDAAELKLKQPHVNAMETRPATLDGLPAIGQAKLLQHALRMRPDRIILGECRGAEAFDLLTGMNTGHGGSLSTLHANGPRDAISRFTDMVLMAGYDLPLRVIRSQIVSTVDLIVQTERMKDGVRRITAITEITGLEGETVATQDLFLFETETVNEVRTTGNFRWQGIRPRCLDKMVQYGFGQKLSKMMRENG